MHQPRKRFGQHFLTDQAIIQRIVATIAPNAKQHLIEIGPGQGALTIPVLQQAQQLEVIELDRDLVVELNERFGSTGQLIVHAADVLAFDFATLKTDARLLRIFGNLPYNISTPLLFHLLEYADLIDDMVFMLQKEVAMRMAAQPKQADYGRLSVMLQYACSVDVLFHVPPQAFDPPPKVQSSIVRLKPHRTLPFPVNDKLLLARLVQRAFGQRRKTLRNSLKAMVTDDIWNRVDIRSDTRPEALSVKDFVVLANAMGEPV